jgi:hypothetical protein
MRRSKLGEDPAFVARQFLREKVKENDERGWR